MDHSHHLERAAERPSAVAHRGSGLAEELAALVNQLYRIADAQWGKIDSLRQTCPNVVGQISELCRTQHAFCLSLSLLLDALGAQHVELTELSWSLEAIERGEIER